MAYDEKLAERIRGVLSRRRGVVEKKMFGGVAFMLRGNMCCGVVDNMLCLRLGEAGADKALERANTKPMDFTGKPLKTMVYVTSKGIRTATQLKKWVDESVAFTKSLPPK